MSNTRQSTFRIVAIRQPFAVFELRPWRPQLNIYETEQGTQLIAELAGVAPDDLHLQVHPTAVEIHGTRQIATPPGLRRIQRLEIASGPFRIEVSLTTPIDPEHAEARYTNGLLDIRLPFARQSTQRVVVIRLGEGGAR
jgi:HSP20 family molecular chaperone IbpA